MVIGFAPANVCFRGAKRTSRGSERLNDHSILEKVGGHDCALMKIQEGWQFLLRINFLKLKKDAIQIESRFTNGQSSQKMDLV